MAGVIQGLDVNYNLYLLIRFDGACSSNIEFILSKNDSIDRFTHLVGPIEIHQTNFYENSHLKSLFE